MIQVKTANGELFEVKWIGIASLDGVLRFASNNVFLQDVLNTFTVPENCTVLSKLIDGEEVASFEGYTVFRGIQINYDNEMIIALSKI